MTFLSRGIVTVSLNCSVIDISLLSIYRRIRLDDTDRRHISARTLVDLIHLLSSLFKLSCLG